MAIVRNVVNFMIGRNASRGVARMFGLSSLASIIGIVGGLRYMRRRQTV
jgi:glucose uptake protein GlcU